MSWLDLFCVTVTVIPFVCAALAWTGRNSWCEPEDL